MLIHFKRMAYGLIFLSIILGGATAIGVLFRVFPCIFVASTILAVAYLAGEVWMESRRP